jgi:hypothetical protein
MPDPAVAAADPAQALPPDPATLTTGGDGSAPAVASATDTAAAAASAAAVTAATTQPQAVTPPNPPDPIAAAAAGALAALLDVAGDTDADPEVRVTAARAIFEACDDATVHALIKSIPQVVANGTDDYDDDPDC